MKEGAGKAIGKALSLNTTLMQLRLDHNALGKEAGRAIGKALVLNTTLTQLDLGWNSLGWGQGRR